MAIFNPGPLLGQISGRIGGSIFSHNKGGAYIRNGSIPTAVSSAAAIAAKNRVSVLSQSWAGLTDAQRLGWKTYAEQTPVINRLGNSITIPPMSHYIGINSRLMAAADTVLDVPPIAAPPDPLLTLTAVGDIGAGEVMITFTGTPLGAGIKLWVEACILESSTVNYLKNRLRLLLVSAAAQATDLDIEAELLARFGTLQVGQELHLMCRTFASATGLLSGPLHSQVTITET